MTEQYRAEVFDADGEVALAPPTLVGRDQAQNVQDIVIANLPQGPISILLTALDAQQHSVGFAGQQLTLGNSEALVDIDRLYNPGQIREVGRVSLSTNGTQANSACRNGRISGDGRFVVFQTPSRLVSSDTNKLDDIYLRDRTAGSTTRISLIPGTPVADFTNHCQNPEISNNGRFVVFESDGKVFLRDRGGTITFSGGFTGISPASTRQVSVSTITEGGTTFPVTLVPGQTRISGQGNKVAYTVKRNGTAKTSIILYDRVNQTSEIISKTADNSIDGSLPALSEDGRLVFFHKASGVQGIYALDRTTNTARLLRPVTLTQVLFLDCSGDGSLVVSNENDGQLRSINVTTSQTNVEVANANSQGRISLSANGELLAFSSATSLVDNDSNEVSDVYVFDRTKHKFSRLSVTSDGFSCEGGAFDADLAADGSRAAFTSPDRLLVPDDSNQQDDIFSAEVPKGGILYTADFDVIVATLDAANADHTPVLAGQPIQLRRRFINLVHAPTQQIAIKQLILDPLNDRLYALSVNSGEIKSVSIVVVENASRASGDVTPRRVIRLGGSLSRVSNVQIDLTRNQIYLAGTQALPDPLHPIVPDGQRLFTFKETLIRYSLAGRADILEPEAIVTLSSITDLKAGRLLLDSRQNELYMNLEGGSRGDVDLIVFSNADSVTSDLATATRRLRLSLDRSSFLGRSLSFDISPRASDTDTNFANLIVSDASKLFRKKGPTFIPLLGEAFVPATPDLPGNSLLPASFLPFAVDRTNGEIYITDGEGKFKGVTYVFRGNISNSVAPYRIVAAHGSGIALDRTR